MKKVKQHSLRKKCPYSELFCSVFPVFELNTDQNNTEYGHFFAVTLSLLIKKRLFQMKYQLSFSYFFTVMCIIKAINLRNRKLKKLKPTSMVSLGVRVRTACQESLRFADMPSKQQLENNINTGIRIWCLQSCFYVFLQVLI